MRRGKDLTPFPSPISERGARSDDEILLVEPWWAFGVVRRFKSTSVTLGVLWPMVSDGDNDSLFGMESLSLETSPVNTFGGAEPIRSIE